MTDVFDKKKRSDVMSRIRSAGTGIEEVLYWMVVEAVGSQGRVRRNVKHLPGNPDVLIPSLKIAVFADGCFYHVCPVHGRTPSSNTKYWQPKLLRNVARDRRNRRSLREEGYSVWRFWEHDLEGRRIERTRVVVARRLRKRLVGQPAA